MSPKSKLKALDTLMASRGWNIVREVMEQEQVAAAMEIAANPNMTLDEINFRRGAIWAAAQFLNIPERLIQRTQADLALTKDDDLKSAEQ